MSTNNGEPAFPCDAQAAVTIAQCAEDLGNPNLDGAERIYLQSKMNATRGMTLRDYFAAHAPTPESRMSLDEHTAYRYRYADAMLKARES